MLVLSFVLTYLPLHFNARFRVFNVDRNNLILDSTLTIDRLAVASLTREMTLRRATPIPSIDKIENRFIHELIFGRH